MAKKKGDVQWIFRSWAEKPESWRKSKAQELKARLARVGQLIVEQSEEATRFGKRKYRKGLVFVGMKRNGMQKNWAKMARQSIMSLRKKSGDLERGAEIVQLNNFQAALAYAFENEGGFANHKDDKGGWTKYGITREVYSRWCHRTVSLADMKNITKDEAENIYFSWYWRANDLHKVDSLAIATALFDIGIVRGLSVPIKYVQEIINRSSQEEWLAVDGHNGPKTLARINKMDPNEFISRFYERVARGFKTIVQSNPSQEVFLKGWLKRADRLLTLMDNTQVPLR